MRELILDYGDVFTNSGVDLGLTNKLQHWINIGDASPIKQRPHRIPCCERPKVEGEVHKLRDADVN